MYFDFFIGVKGVIAPCGRSGVKDNTNIKHIHNGLIE
jgi:hypothetical protein